MSTNKENHVALWNWMAETGSCDKEECPIFKDVPADASESFNYCFACKEAASRQEQAIKDNELCGAKSMCNWCPLDWKAQNCTCDNTLFIKWMTASTYGNMLVSKILAAQIRDMEWRDE